MPPYCEVESPPPCDVLRFRGHVRISGISGLVIEVLTKLNVVPNKKRLSDAPQNSTHSPGTGRVR